MSYRCFCSSLMLKRTNARKPRQLLRGTWHCSPALVDVDIIDFICLHGCFCERLDHVVTLKYNISLRWKRDPGLWLWLYSVCLPKSDYVVINRDRTISIGQHGKATLQAWWRSQHTYGSLFIYKGSVMGTRDSPGTPGEQGPGDPHPWAQYI